MPLDKYLNLETLRTVAEFARHANPVTVFAAPAAASRKGTGQEIPAIHVGAKKVPVAALSQQAIKDAHRMADVYPLLYAFENSVREWIDRHLAHAYGPTWHESPKLVGKTPRDAVERNRKAEDKHRYHSKRNAGFIYYTEINHLPTIVKSEDGWKVFDKLLPSPTWLEGIVERIATSRNVVAHMNPIAQADIRRIEGNFQDWLTQIKGKEQPT